MLDNISSKFVREINGRKHRGSRLSRKAWRVYWVLLWAVTDRNYTPVCESRRFHSLPRMCSCFVSQTGPATGNPPRHMNNPSPMLRDSTAFGHGTQCSFKLHTKWRFFHMLKNVWHPWPQITCHQRPLETHFLNRNIPRWAHRLKQNDCLISGRGIFEPCSHRGTGKDGGDRAVTWRTELCWLGGQNVVSVTDPTNHIHTSTYIYTYIHTYTHTYIYAYIHTYTHTHEYIHTHTHTHVYNHIHIHTHIHTHIYTYTHTYIHTHTHTHVYNHIHIHTHIHTHIHIYIHTHIHTHIHTYIHTHTYIYTYIHTYTHIHTYIHTHTHTHKYIHTHTYIHTYTYMHAYTHILTRWFTYDRDYLCVNKSQFVSVIFEPPCIYIHTHTYIHAYKHTYIYTYTHTFIYTHTYKHIYTHIQTYIHTNTRTPIQCTLIIIIGRGYISLLIANFWPHVSFLTTDYCNIILFTKECESHPSPHRWQTNMQFLHKLN
jgi:hypothetical protein